MYLLYTNGKKATVLWNNKTVFPKVASFQKPSQLYSETYDLPSKLGIKSELLYGLFSGDHASFHGS